MAIRFFEEDTKARLTNKTKLKNFILQKIKEHKESLQEIDINYIFCTDDALLQKNKEFLNHDTFTDIITFDLSPAEALLHAEIYISIDRVAENAKSFGVTYQNELHRVIFHGILHLLGYGDKTEKESKVMRQMETNFLNQYGLAI